MPDSIQVLLKSLEEGQVKIEQGSSIRSLKQVQEGEDTKVICEIEQTLPSINTTGSSPPGTLTSRSTRKYDFVIGADGDFSQVCVF